MITTPPEVEILMSSCEHQKVVCDISDESFVLVLLLKKNKQTKKQKKNTN